MAIAALEPTEPFNLKNKSILITGGASGLGKHATEFFAASGAFVTFADVQDGSSIAKNLTSQGYKARFVQCDVTDYNSQIRAFQAALDFSPSKTLHTVAAFAGVDNAEHLVSHVSAIEPSLTGPAPPIPNIKALEVNTIGTFFTTTLALHYLRIPPSQPLESMASGSKSLIIVSSLAGYIDDTHNSSYTTSKFGARGTFRAIRERAKSDLNIRVNMIAPWAMRTPMTAPILDQIAKLGIVEGKGITLVPHDVLTQAVARISVDGTITGRAFAIVPEGAIDIGDDIEGGYGGEVLRELMDLRKKAGDFLSS